MLHPNPAPERPGQARPRRRLQRSLHAWSSLTLRASIVLDFVTGGYGAAYGVGARQRAWLVTRFYRAVRTIPAGTTALAHVLMAREILSTPPIVAGDVIECGTWKGASAASLSLICQLVGRRLLVCDSFQGLPAIAPQLYLAPHNQTYGYLRGGMFCGALPEVQDNIRRLGCLAVCDFVPGYFAASLASLRRPLIFGFLDVDLPASFHDCLRAIWPNLAESAALYVDDVGCLNIAQIFFDDPWWQAQLGCPAPGLVGSGCGLPVSPSYSNVGYARKWPPFQPGQWQPDPHLALRSSQ